MSQQHQTYHVYGDTINTLISSLNQAFNLIANRLDQLEGLRGIPTVYTSRINYPASTIEGALTAQSDGVSADYDVPTTLKFSNAGLKLLDIDGTHFLIISPGSDLSADRTLTITTGDSNRTITINGNPTLADWFDQEVKTSSSPTFAGLTLAGDIDPSTTTQARIDDADYITVAIRDATQEIIHEIPLSQAFSPLSAWV